MFDYFLKNIVTREFFLTSFIKQEKKKKKNAFKHESVLHRVIPVQPRNLVKKTELGTLWKHPLTSEWCCLEIEGEHGPRSVTSPSWMSPKEPCPCCSWPRPCRVPDKLYSLCFVIGVRNCHFNMQKHFVCCSENQSCRQLIIPQR